MAIAVETLVELVTIAENGIVSYRESTRTIENCVELSKTHRQATLTPGQDLTNIPRMVVEICNDAWTPEIIAAYQAQIVNVNN